MRRLLEPLLLVLLGATLLVVVLTAATIEVFDPDVYWMAAAGREWLATGHVPHANLFSFTAPEHPWVMHEWLLSPLYAWAADAGAGWLNALSLFGVLSVSGLVLGSSAARARHPAAGLAAALLFLGPFALHMVSPRPTVIARVLPVAMALLAFGDLRNAAPRVTRGHVALAVLLEWLWASTHGSFPVGVGLLVAGALETRAASDRRRLLVAACLGALVTFLGPYGVDLHRLVLGYLGGGDPTLALVHAHVIEFRPLWALPPETEPWLELAGWVALLALSVAALREPRERVRGVFCLLFVALSALQIRHLTLALLFGTLLLLPTFDRLVGRLGAPTARRAPVAKVLLLVLGPAALVGMVTLGAALQRRAPDDWVGARLGGPELGRLVGRAPEGARVYAGFPVAGRVIWLGHPRGVRVFYDSRNDCYPADVARDAFRLGSPEVGGEEALAILERWGGDHALVGPDTRFRDAIADSPAWRAVDREEGWTLYAHVPAPPP